MIIGIPTREIIENGISKEFINNQYLEAINHFEQVLVLFIPYVTNKLLDYLDMCDGFLIPGGNDMDPSYYGQININSQVIRKEIDELDYQVFLYASKNKKPIFGICRGFQDLNVYLGGTLNQDIKGHSDVLHEVELDRNEFKMNKVTVTSYHHQSILKLGKNLKVLGMSKDGVIEIIEHESLPFFAVQFHPEKSYDRDGHIFFEYFFNKYMKRQ